MTDTTNAMTDTISNNTTGGEQIDDGYGPAFPYDEPVDNGEMRHWVGMRKREFAAIAFRVPDSGLAWLDAMIVEARRLDYAGQALKGILAGPFSRIQVSDRDTPGDVRRRYVGEAVSFADALIAALKRDRT